LRRIIITLTALAVLAVAAVAFAAAPFNTYTGSMKFDKAVGTPSKPVPMGFSQKLTATGTKGNRAAPLTDLRSTIYGMVSDGKDFATCSFATISAASNDATCPPAALVATANVDALLGPGSNPSSNAKKADGTTAITPCHPGLRVWNSGQGKLSFFFWSTTAQGSAHYCGGIPTGATPPYTGTITQKGKNMILDVPLPAYVSTAVLKNPTWGSLVSEVITWKNKTIKKGGKTKAFFSSVGCQNNKRAWTQLFTANFLVYSSTGKPGPNKIQSFTKTGSGAC
jgi:hypothetical protein